MARLGVNIDHVATLRQVRKGVEPEPVLAALICQSAGAESIVAHLREDRRHINERDVCLLKEVVRVTFNLEMSCAEEIVAIACKIAPDQATLVPEKRLEVTTESGLDVVRGVSKISKTVSRLKDAGIEVSLFIDPDKKQIDASLQAGVKIIELHTGRFADAKNKISEKRYFEELRVAALYAHKKGLKVCAGHGLTYYNVSRIASIGCIEEFNIGYSVICRAVTVGLDSAVRQMRALLG